MDLKVTKSLLNSPTKFKAELKDYIDKLTEFIREEYSINFDFDEFGDLLLSACRVNEFDILEIRGIRKRINPDNVIDWIDKKLIPNTMVLRFDDPDIIRLLIFSFEITYKMFSGQSRATVTQKGFRERKRTFESIVVDQFVGKLGEVVTKKFLENNFNASVKLDWEISKNIEKYRNDIVNAKYNISIKSTPNLASIWAESDIGYDYGVMVKCSVPQPTIIQFFIEVCGFLRLLNFAENIIPADDFTFRNYIDEMKSRIVNYKCGEIQSEIKGILCGYFKTKDFDPVKSGVYLEYLGEVREERYLVRISDLMWKNNAWLEFCQQNDLI